MKILHAADLHLDTPFTGRPEAELRYLKKALLTVPEQIAGLCRLHGCDLLLLAGDLFDGPASRESLDALKAALADIRIPVFISPGNHDFCGPHSPYILESWPENVHIFKNSTITSIMIPALDCRVYGAGFESMDCPALLENFHLEGCERHHIGLLHGDPIQKNAPYNPIRQEQVAASGLDYLALGHVHKGGSFTAGNTLCGWPGCPMGRGNDELGDKGVYLVTLEDYATITFLPLEGPKFYDLEAEVLDTPENAVRGLLPPVGSKDIYRVTLTGEAEAFDVNTLSFPEFPHLELRDRTVPPVDIWSSLGQDNLEGIFFQILRDTMEADPETATLAAKIARKILDGREVALP